LDLWGSFLFLVCFGLYLRTLCPVFMDDDSPETIAAGVKLGLAHPPSYALDTLWVRLVSFLPLGGVAFQVNVGSALLAAFTAVLLARNILMVLDHFLQTPPAQHPGGKTWFKVACAASGALLLAFSHTYWEKALGAKGGIYLWQALLSQLIFYFFLQFELEVIGKAIKSRWLYLVLLLFGLGLTNHWQTQIIFLPLLLIMLIRRPFTPQKWLLGSVFFVIGTSVLLYLPLRSNLHPGWNLGEPDNLSRFLDSFFRRYVNDRETSLIGLFFQVLHGQKTWSDLSQLAHRILDIQGTALGPHLISDLKAPALLLALLGLASPWTASGKKAFLALLLPAAFLLLLFLTYFWVPTNIPYHWYIDNFLLSLNIAGAFLAALGLYRLGSLLPPRLAFLPLPMAFLLLFGLADFNFPLQNQEHQTLRYDYGVNLLKSSPRNSVFFAEADEDYFPAYYLRAVEHKRLDIEMIPAFTLFETWGVAQVARLHPDLGLTAPTRDFPDKFARLISSLSEIAAKNRDRTPCTYSYFNGAFHRYYFPYHPSELVLKSGVLYELASPVSTHAPRLPASGLRLRNLDDPSNSHESLRGILHVYQALGLL